MARKFLTPIDLNKNELQNAVIQNLASAPGSPSSGQIYYNTSENVLYVYNGNGWQIVGGIITGTIAGRPAAGPTNSGLFYYATDNYLLYYSNGTLWQQTNNFGTGLSTSVGIAGSSADGVSTNYARADHAHAGPGFGTVSSQTSYGASSSDGTASTVARADHTHGTPSLTSNAATNISATSAAVGTGTAPARDDHTHGFTPSDFSLSDFDVPTGNIDFDTNKITNLADPTSPQDAATKNYVDGVAQGLNVHDAVHVATTATLTAAYTAGTVGADGGLGVGAYLTNTGTLAALEIDNHALNVGDRVLVKNQTTGTQNGIYEVTVLGSNSVAWVLTRASDSDNHIAGQLTAGDFVWVTNGDTYGSTGWAQSAVGTATTPVKGIKIGTDVITYTQFSGEGTYTPGYGLDLVGTEFSFKPTTSGGLQASGSGASIKLATNSGLTTDSSGLYITAGTGIAISGGTVSVDSTTPQKYSANIGDGSSTTITVTHSLGTKDVTVAVYDNSSPYAEVVCDVNHTSTSAVTLVFSVAPTSNQYRVVVIG